MSSTIQFRQRPHRGRLRHDPAWINTRALELHCAFAAAAGVSEDDYVHPIKRASVMLKEEMVAKKLSSIAFSQTRKVQIPGTKVSLHFWATTGGDVLVLKEETGRKPGSFVFAARYPGKLSFDQVVEKYQGLANDFGARLASMGEADIARAA
ncbi:hypothetical protein [Duganella vulcania]|uniref:Uncharacterized protein n=1 Tax=Duganella vulcania TaxID=2692166 RepID=A0A845GH41_9BURK|nr:hypothetical protein [Duganella vulcania]MYM92742.1 hypothetical protein [Duganella vulcania]